MQIRSPTSTLPERLRMRWRALLRLHPVPAIGTQPLPEPRQSGRSTARATTANTEREIVMNRRQVLTSAASLVAAASSIVTLVIAPALAHEGHDHGNFSAGEPGDPKKPARVIKVKMREDGDKKFFDPARLEVRRGEQIRFAIQNDGSGPHEFVLATAAENRKHADEMKK